MNLMNLMNNLLDKNYYQYLIVKPLKFNIKYKIKYKYINIYIYYMSNDINERLIHGYQTPVKIRGA